jgi:outer membrane protein
MKACFKHSISLLLLFFTAVTALAQAPAPRSYTLQEAIAHAVEHNVTVKDERLNLGIAEAQIKETLAQGLPQINAAGNITYNIVVPTSFIPLQAFDPTAPPDLYQPVQFGIPYTSNVSIGVNQLLFSGSYFVGLQASKVFRELSEKNVQKANIDVAEAVSLAYYGALVSEERLKLLRANLQRLDTLYRETRIMYENGFVEGIDVQRLQVNLNNLRTEYDNVERSLALNLAALKFQMGVPMNQPIELAERISDFQAGALSDSDFQYQQRIEYQQLETTRQLARLDIRNTRSQYYPTLSAFGNLGYNAGKTRFPDLFRETQDFYLTVNDEQVLVDARTWNQFAAVGINLNVPIFDGFLKANTIRRKKLVAEQVDNQMRNLENAIDLEMEQARINLQNSLQSLETQQENMDLAQEVFRVSKIKYQQGVGSSLEVVEAENALKTAETNYYQSLYNALVARVAYDKAIGILLQN